MALRRKKIEEGMLVRYTRQLATAALIVAAGLGMGACSAHPGVAVSSSTGDYSIEEVNEAVSQLGAVTGGQSSIGAQQVRAQLINEPQLVAVAASVGIVMNDEQVDQALQQTAQQAGGQIPTIGRGTRAVVRSLLLGQELNRYAEANPAAVSGMNAAFAQARDSSDARINPRFTQPSLGGGQGAAMPMFGDAVSGAQNDPMAALMGGGAS